MATRLVCLGLILAMRIQGQAPTQWVLFDDISAPFNDMLSDGDRMLGVGSEGLIAASSDGAGWTRIPSGTGSSLFGILHTDAGYLAYGSAGLVLTSPDGKAWTTRQTPPGTGMLQYGAYGNGTYVLIDNAYRVITSKDGAAWTAAPKALTGAQGFLRDFAFGAGRFLVVGDRSLQESADGMAWTDHSADANLSISHIVRGDSVFLASAAPATGTAGIYKSADGLAWTRIGGAFPCNVLRYSARGYLSAGPGRVDMSADGVTWTTAAAGTTDAFYHVAAAKGGFAAAGSNLASSPDGKGWTVRKFGNHYSLNAVAYGNGRFVAVGDWSGMQMSPDGTLWTTLARPGSGFFKSVTFANDLFVAAGESGRFATSPDGDTWTTDSVATTQDLGDIAYGSAGFVAVAYNWPAPSQGSVWGSADGKAWANLVPKASVYRAIAFGNGRYVAVGFGGVMAWSADGKAWTQAVPLATPRDLIDIAFGGGLFAAVGMHGAIATSPDGAAWTDRTTDTQVPLNAVTHNGKQFIAIGGEDVMRISQDGAVWSEGTSPQGVGTAIAYGGGRHVMISGSQSLATGDALITAGIRPGPSPRASGGGVHYLEARTGAWLILPAARTAAVARLRGLQGRIRRNFTVTGARAPGISLQGVPPGLYVLDVPREDGPGALVLRVTP